MARVKAPLLSEEAHGNLGGIEYRTGHYGHMVGRRSIASRAPTKTALLVRSRLKLANAAWTALGDADRRAWDQYARLPLTGRNAYVGAYLRANGNPTNFPMEPMLPWSPDEFTNVNVVFFPGPPLIVSVTWDTDLSHITWGMVYAAATWRSGEIVTPSRWRYQFPADSSGGTANILFPFLAPYFHIKIDWLHDASNVVYRQSIFRIVT